MRIIHNKFEKEFIILNDDQEICPRCKGMGYNRECGDTEGEYCHICDGDGYVDWVRYLYVQIGKRKILNLKNIINENVKKKNLRQNIIKS